MFKIKKADSHLSVGAIVGLILAILILIVVIIISIPPLREAILSIIRRIDFASGLWENVIINP